MFLAGVLTGVVRGADLIARELPGKETLQRAPLGSARRTNG
jgi:hypothetical protein